MTTTIAPAGSRFADWSSARNVWGGLAAVGCHGGSRYISPSYSPYVTSGKCISLSERDEFFKRGWWLLLNWEASATDPLQGAPLGTAHGKICLRALRSLQYPVNPELKITVSVDTDARNYLPKIRQYFYAFKQELAEYGQQMNIYGGSYEINYLADFCGAGWLTTSKSWSDPAVWRAINAGNLSSPLLSNVMAYQTPVGSTSQWDMDYLIKPVRVWTGLGPDGTNDPSHAIEFETHPEILPSPEDDSMLIYTQDDQGVWILHAGKMLHLTDPKTYESAHNVPTIGSTAPGDGISTGELSRFLTTWPPTIA